jgi:cellulose biosynthesis protein BcsQ
VAIIALANLKGGVGKSTLAVSIAGALAPKSVLVDADPQAKRSASAIVGDAMEAHRAKVEAELRELRGR